MEIAGILDEAGFEVVGPVGSVGQALELLGRFGCDLAVLDINLGRETAEPIARELSASGTPYVTISGYARDQLPDAFRSAPLIAKLLRPRQLVNELRKFEIQNQKNTRSVDMSWE